MTTDLFRMRRGNHRWWHLANERRQRLIVKKHKGGGPISHRAIDWAKCLLGRLGPGWAPVPCSDGSVQLEFHEQGVDIEIVVSQSSERKAME